MRSLVKDYNRVYYRRITWIWLRKWFYLVRLRVAGWLWKLSWKLEPRLQRHYNDMMRQRYDIYYGID